MREKNRFIDVQDLTNICNHFCCKIYKYIGLVIKVLYELLQQVKQVLISEQFYLLIDYGSIILKNILLRNVTVNNGREVGTCVEEGCFERLRVYKRKNPISTFTQF